MSEQNLSSGRAPAVQLVGVNKTFDNVKAVKSLNLTIPLGSTYGLLGPNGAGKTTTIRMILRIIDPDTGKIDLFGHPLSSKGLDRIGYLPEERGIYKNMKVRRLLTFFAELKGMPDRVSKPKIKQWLERFDLGDRAESKVKELSKGNQQKVQFISAILHEPDIMILDEPFSGLDPLNQQILKDIIVDLKSAGKTIIFSTHIIEHAERICDHVCIIARGEKVADGTLSAVKTEHGGEYVAVVFERWSSDSVAVVEQSPHVDRVRQNGQLLEVGLKDNADPQALLKQLVDAGVRLKRFESTEPSLEQIFLESVGASDEMISEIGASHV
ncbi:MAG TPA: ATP-binding cassette domain-containing protein [Longimicrobiales bacterium]|nr:ATP-binding cassette domain-containing protein [Longimicrobiales bacterium]